MRSKVLLLLLLFATASGSVLFLEITCRLLKNLSRCGKADCSMKLVVSLLACCSLSSLGVPCLDASAARHESTGLWD